MDHGTRDPAPAPTTAPEPTENTPQRRKRIAQEQLAREKQENEAIEAEAELAEVKRRRRAAAKRLADLRDADNAYGNPERPSTSPQRPLGEIRSPDLPAGYLAPSSRTLRRATPGPRRSFAAARLGLRAPIAAEELGFAATTTRPGPHPLHAHDQGLVIDCDLPEPSPSPLF